MVANIATAYHAMKGISGVEGTQQLDKASEKRIAAYAAPLQFRMADEFPLEFALLHASRFIVT